MNLTVYRGGDILVSSGTDGLVLNCWVDGLIGVSGRMIYNQMSRKHTS